MGRQPAWLTASVQRAQIAHRPAGGHGVASGDDGVGVDAEVPVEVVDRSGLAEMLDTEAARAVALDRTQPSERGRMPVRHGDDGAMAGQVCQQAFDMAPGMDEAALAGAA